VWFCGCETLQEKYSRELTVFVRAEFGQRMRDMCMLEQILAERPVNMNWFLTLVWCYFTFQCFVVVAAISV